MNNKRYNCFSYNQMKFLAKNNVSPVHAMIHSRTKKTFWIYEQTEELGRLLTLWTQRKNVARSEL